MKRDEKRNKHTYKMAQYNYEKAFCDEMCKVNSLKIVSLYQQECFPKNKLIFVRKSRKYLNRKIQYIWYINLPFIKELIYFISACFIILFWNFGCKDEQKKCIFANLHYAPVSLAIVFMGKILGVKKVIAFTDLSLYTYSDEKIGKMPLYKKVLIKPYVRVVNKLQKSYDLYILFSEPMKDVVNKAGKPYLVMEGIYNPDGIVFEKQEKCNAILYAGKLNREVGVQKILDVFNMIDDDSLELWFLGNGDMKDEILEASKINKNIKYLGFRDRKEVFRFLQKAKLLINLRNPDDEYTKYSFPSKTFEYMVSGTPMISTDLEGIPDEYKKYMFMVDYSDEKIVDKIYEILNLDDTFLEEFGKKAREFVLNEKTPCVQVKRVSRFLKSYV